MTDERITEIEALLATITPGEWRSFGDDSYGRWEGGWTIVKCNRRTGVQCKADAAFIAAAPDLVRELLLTINDQRAQVNNLVNLLLIDQQQRPVTADKTNQE